MRYALAALACLFLSPAGAGTVPMFIQLPSGRYLLDSTEVNNVPGTVYVCFMRAFEASSLRCLSIMPDGSVLEVRRS